MANTFERTRHTGLLLHDREKTCPGYVIYSPIYSSGEVYLLDMEGNTTHRWETGYPAGLWGYLLPNGNLFYGGKDPNQVEPNRFVAWQAFRGGAMLELDPQGNVVWEHHDDHHHHDARRTEAGGAIFLTVERMDEALAAQVAGGFSDGNATMWADVLVEVDANGTRVWEWRVIEHLNPADYPITFNDARHEWSHANTVVPIPAQADAGEKVLVSFRNISSVMLIDKATGNIDWELRSPLLAQQHDPTLLDNGNLLVFDNGCHRPNIPLSFSRVLEIEPTTGKIAWQYMDTPWVDFFSPFISGARRLPNGNTLITEGNSGRIFQVTTEGEVVWEYVNPHVGPDPMGSYLVGRNAVFRASHYSAEQIPWLT